METIAGSDAATRMALAVSRGSTDYSAYVNEAKTLADNQQLDFLEFVDSSGTILSSAQWPAKFGYKESSLPAGAPLEAAFLRQEELPDGAALSLSAIRQVEVGDKPIFVIGGRRLDQDFMASLELPAGMRAMLYRNLAKGFLRAAADRPCGRPAATGAAGAPDRASPATAAGSHRTASLVRRCGGR